MQDRIAYLSVLIETWATGDDATVAVVRQALKGIVISVHGQRSAPSCKAVIYRVFEGFKALDLERLMKPLFFNSIRISGVCNRRGLVGNRRKLVCNGRKVVGNGRVIHSPNPTLVVS